MPSTSAEDVPHCTAQRNLLKTYRLYDLTNGSCGLLLTCFCYSLLCEFTWKAVASVGHKQKTKRPKQFSVNCFVDGYEPDQNTFQEMCVKIMRTSSLKTMTCSGLRLFPEIKESITK